MVTDCALHEGSTAKEIDPMEPVTSSRTSVNRSSNFEESDPMASTLLPNSSFSKASTAKGINSTCSEKPSRSAFCRSTTNGEVDHSSSSVNASRTSLCKDFTTEEICQMSSVSLSRKHFSRDSTTGDTDHMFLASSPCLLTTGDAADDEVRNGACTHAHSPDPVPVRGHDPFQGGDPAVDTNTSSLKMATSEQNVHGHSAGAAHHSDLQGAQHPNDTGRSSELYSQDMVLTLDVTTKDVEFVSGGKAKDMVSHSEDFGKTAEQNSGDDGRATKQNSGVLYGGNATDAEAAVLMIPTRGLTRAERLKVDVGVSVKTFVNNMVSVVSCPSVLLLCLQLVLSSAGIGIILVHYINFCLSMGSTFNDVSLGFSANGFAMTVARFMLGVLAQDRHIDPLCVYVGMALITSLVLMLMPMVAVTASLQILGLAVLGVYAGASYVLLTEITIHCAGLDTLSLTFGLEMVSAGLGYLVAPPTAGWLVVWTGSYSYAIFLAGVLYLMSAVVAMLLSLTRPKWSPEGSSSWEKDVTTPDDVTDTS